MQATVWLVCYSVMYFVLIHAMAGLVSRALSYCGFAEVAVTPVYFFVMLNGLVYPFPAPFSFLCVVLAYSGLE
jgi:hypothetical protein